LDRDFDDYCDTPGCRSIAKPVGAFFVWICALRVYGELDRSLSDDDKAALLLLGFLVTFSLVGRAMWVQMCQQPRQVDPTAQIHRAGDIEEASDTERPATAPTP
jgi:hypothetical protein